MSSGREGNIQLKTVPPDARFHNQNVTDWCMVSFIDYHKCIRLLGEGNSCCSQFNTVYRAICPHAWVKRWEEQIEAGTFPVELPPSSNDCSKLPTRRMNI